MAVKKCCVKTCKSCSSRREDIGVTYHKLPKDSALCDLWIRATRHKQQKRDQLTYVCSRHFCKSDFQIYKGSKYVLKSGAIPSIFAWEMSDVKEIPVEIGAVESEKEDTKCESEANEVLNSSKESETENVEAIKKFIEEQDRHISEQKEDQSKDKLTKNMLSTMLQPLIQEDTIGAEQNKTVEENVVDDEINRIQRELQDETLAVASSVMDMILSESEAKIAKGKDSKVLTKQTLNAGDKNSGDKGNNSMALSVGSKVEAKDFGEFWYPAQIVEVDYDDMEVLVHYENVSKKHDEWISVSSPRLRPLGSTTDPSTPTTNAPEAPPPTSLAEGAVIKEEPNIEDSKHDEKPKLMFAVGERCLARWRDNRRFIATVNVDLGDGKYEIVFDDGVRWTCNTSRLSKLKEPKKESLTIDTTLCSSVASTPSPVYGPGPSNAGENTIPAPLPAYHTHLFDPTRDYLGSKSERREMKRKLNIKELFNIGQKKQKIDHTPKVKPTRVVKDKKPKVVKKKVVKLEVSDVKVKTEIKKEIPDAVASIIGTVSVDVATKTETIKEVEKCDTSDIKIQDENYESKLIVDDNFEIANSETLSAPETQDMKHEDDPVLEEEVKLEKFEKSDDAHEEVIDRIKEVITKLEDGLNQSEIKVEKESPKPSIKEEIKTDEIPKPVVSEPMVKVDDTKPLENKPKKNLSKVKKGKKLRLLQEKKVKKQVEKVKSELEEMKKQVEEMRKQMMLKTEELAKSKESAEMPESFLLPGEWCCKWVNGQPVGTVSELECDAKVDSNSKPALPRRSVQVEDKRLPSGWTKHMVRRSVGHSAGKWDVVIVSPDYRRFHTKTDMSKYLELNPDAALKPYENALLDFGVHLKLSRRMGWYKITPGGEQESPVTTLPAGTLYTTSPLVKRKNLSLKTSKPKNIKEKKKKLRMKLKVPRQYHYEQHPPDTVPGTSEDVAIADESTTIEDGYVYVGSLKVQILENLLRCPAEGCFKNFRNNTLLKMHIKHYHRELRKMLGATPKVLDLAYARTRPTDLEMRRLKLGPSHKTIKIKLPRLPKRLTEPKTETKDASEIRVDTPTTPKPEERIPRSQDSPKLRHALINKPVKRPKVLLPVRRPEPTKQISDQVTEEVEDCEEKPVLPAVEVPVIEPLDFETAISTHTVTKPAFDVKAKGEKKRKSFATIAKKALSEDEEWFTMNNSDVETRSSYPRSGTPDSKIMDQKLVSSESNEDQKDSNMYMFTETGERIKIVHMKREEIINCHCGFREEDGLMVQCELCLCWQHALCHNIQKESEVPEKYTCSICLNPRRGRRSQRFLHDQDRLYEGLLPGAKPCESLRRSHELSGNLLRIEDALHALRVKYYVATKKDHPKLYLWAKDWDTGEINITQEKLNSDYSDLNIMISNIGKENLPIKPEEIKDMPLEIRTPPSEEQDADRFSQRENQLGSQSLLSGLLSSPGGASIDLPISTSELERLAKSVQEQESQRCVTAPQPEAAIENSACRERLLRHIQRCQALIDARLDSIEAQVAELESQDPSFEDDETADYFPRTKQTVQMLMRDLDTMEELGVIT